MSDNGVDWHNQVGNCESAWVTVRNRYLVEAVVQGTGEVVAKAVRADVDSPWYFGRLVDDRWYNCGELYAHVPEHLKRKLVADIVRTLAEYGPMR